jgi:hypothetical protein
MNVAGLNVDKIYIFLPALSKYITTWAFFYRCHTGAKPGGLPQRMPGMSGKAGIHFTLHSSRFTVFLIIFLVLFFKKELIKFLTAQCK